jgi:hypothetical protein
MLSQIGPFFLLRRAIQLVLQITLCASAPLDILTIKGISKRTSKIVEAMLDSYEKFLIEIRLTVQKITPPADEVRWSENHNIEIMYSKSVLRKRKECSPHVVEAGPTSESRCVLWIVVLGKQDINIGILRITNPQKRLPLG